MKDKPKLSKLREIEKELSLWRSTARSPWFIYLRLVGRYLIYIIIAIFMVGPFYWLFTISIRGEGSIYAFTLIPRGLNFRSYIEVWTNFYLARNFFNSVIVAAAVVLTNIFFCSMAAYPLARMRFPGRELVFFFILSTLMIPFHLYMIPLYLLCLDLHLGNSYLGLILPMSVTAFGVYLIKQFFITIPKDIEEAARIDGAGEFRIWWKIMFPLTKPAVAALAIFVFVGNWSSFLWPLIILTDQEKFTLPVAIAYLIGVFMDRTSYLAAGSVISIVPVILLFLFLQRYFISGITVGAVKG